jgi:putative methionine-R-sulfoxide reductase with GAF domain
MNIRIKIPLFTGLIVFAAILTITLYSVPDYRKKTIKSIENYRIEQTEIIKNQLKDNVNSAYSMIEHAYLKNKDKYQTSSFIVKEYPEDLKFAINNIEKIRFGDKSSGYVWINEFEPPYTVIMHPIRPEMNGTVQVFYIQNTKQNVYEAFADVIQSHKGEGFLEYDYYKPDTGEKIPKLSYIKLFEPLGWVIGTGIYIDYIDKMVAQKKNELDRQTNRLLTVIIILAFFLITGSFIFLMIFSKSITNSIARVNQKLFQMSKGQQAEIEQNVKSDETGNMNKSLNELITGLNRYSDFAGEIGRGNLNADFKSLGKDDILGNSLINMRNSLVKAKTEESQRREENERRNTANEGYTVFSELIRRGSNNIKELSYSIISNLVNYLKVTQGGIFILNDENPNNIFLELSASVAYNRRKFTEKRIDIGEGLVGACAFEKKKIVVKNVPADYLEIRSGLGKTEPKSILIIPLLMEDNLIGVIELASVNEIDQFDIEFIEKVSETIASSLYAAKINSKTYLLEKEYEKLQLDFQKVNEVLIEKEKEIKLLKKRIQDFVDDKSILSGKQI